MNPIELNKFIRENVPVKLKEKFHDELELQILDYTINEEYAFEQLEDILLSIQEKV